MGSLGKVCGPIVVVLAIAAAVLSFLISNQRQQFRDRAADLAQGIADTAAKLDEGTATGASKNITFTAASAGNAKESGTLGWEDYKKSAKAKDNSYANTIKGATTLAGQVIDQRNQLTASLQEIAGTLGYPATILPSAESLQALESSPAATAIIVEHANKIAERDQAILKNVNAIAALVQAKVQAEKILKRSVNTTKDGDATAGDFKVDVEFDSFKKAVKIYRDRNDQFISVLPKLMGQLKEYRDWSFRPNNLRSNDIQKVRKELENLVNDFGKLNTALKEGKALARETAHQKATIAALEEDKLRLTNEKEAINKQLEELKEQVEPMQAYLKKGNKGPVITSLKDVKVGRNGTVLSVNKEFGFAVVDFTNRDVVVDVPLAVFRNGEYLATLKVTETNDYQSVANIFKGSLDKISEKDDVLVSGLHILTVEKENSAE